MVTFAFICEPVSGLFEPLTCTVDLLMPQDPDVLPEDGFPLWIASGLTGLRGQACQERKLRTFRQRRNGLHTVP